MSENRKIWTAAKKREILKNILPLETPLSIQVEPSGMCNFKCVYCIHSAEHAKEILLKEMLSLEVFKKFLVGAKYFKQKIKTITFCGLGEPLLNKDVYEMIKLSKEICTETNIVTNGSLLTSENSDKLIASGIDNIRISLQGLNAQDYKKTSNFIIDFDKFINNLKYLYEHKGNAKIYLKIVDLVIDTKEKEEEFYKIFENICDNIEIQIIIKESPHVEFNKISKRDVTKKTIYNKPVKNVEVCSAIFFSMFFRANGSVLPCCNVHDYNYQSLEIGNVNDNNIFEIWNSEKLKALRLCHLKGNGNSIALCKRCSFKNQLTSEEDRIDDVKDDLLKEYM